MKLNYLQCDFCGKIGPKGPGFFSSTYDVPWESSSYRPTSIDACFDCRSKASEIVEAHRKRAHDYRVEHKLY